MEHVFIDSVEKLEEAKNRSIALDMPKPYSNFEIVEADSLSDACEAFTKTEAFKAFAENNTGELFFYYLDEKAEPKLITE